MIHRWPKQQVMTAFSFVCKVLFFLKLIIFSALVFCLSAKSNFLSLPSRSSDPPAILLISLVWRPLLPELPVSSSPDRCPHAGARLHLGISPHHHFASFGADFLCPLFRIFLFIGGTHLLLAFCERL